jgi:DnaK suppressor protein
MATKKKAKKKVVKKASAKKKVTAKYKIAAKKSASKKSVKPAKKPVKKKSAKKTVAKKASPKKKTKSSAVKKSPKATVKKTKVSPAKTKTKKKKVKASKKTSTKSIKRIVRKKHSQLDPAVLKIRERLIVNRAELLKLIQASQSVERDAGDLTFSNEIDLASSLEGREMTFQLTSRDRNELKLIEETLFRINNGSYGDCDSCEKKITLKRLQIMPLATLCIECQEDAENF